MPPEVLVDTVRLPVRAVQVMVKLACAVLPAATVTVWGFPSLTLQFAGTPLSCTV